MLWLQRRSERRCVTSHWSCLDSAAVSDVRMAGRSPKQPSAGHPGGRLSRRARPRGWWVRCVCPSAACTGSGRGARRPSARWVAVATGRSESWYPCRGSGQTRFERRRPSGWGGDVVRAGRPLVATTGRAAQLVSPGGVACEGGDGVHITSPLAVDPSFDSVERQPGRDAAPPAACRQDRIGAVVDCSGVPPARLRQPVALPRQRAPGTTLSDFVGGVSHDLHGIN